MKTGSPTAVRRASLLAISAMLVVAGLVGADAGRWVTGVPLVAAVRYHDLYPGIDLVLSAADPMLEYDVVIAPGADPHALALAFAGGRARLDADGCLVVASAVGRVRHG